jgi:cytochrome c biogenesis protein CcdA
MSRESVVFVIGIILFLFPFLGVPQDVKDIITIIGGALLIVLGIILRRAAFLRSIENVKGEREGEMFTESKMPDA